MPDVQTRLGLSIYRLPPVAGGSWMKLITISPIFLL